MTRRNALPLDRVDRIGTIAVIDQSGFTQTMLSKGPLAALRRVWSIRSVLIPLLQRRRGEVYKVDADNLFTYFETVDEAVGACVEAHRELARESKKQRMAGSLQVGIGVGYGPLIYLPSEDDYYGPEVNLASKLGEDVAEGGQLLLTESAAGFVSSSVAGRKGRQQSVRVSGVVIRYSEWMDPE